MSGYQLDQLQDFLGSTLAKKPRMQLVDISHELQEYHALPKVMQKHKVAFEGGSQYEWPINDGLGNAKHTSIFETETTSRTDSLLNAAAPLRFSNTYTLYDEREAALNSGRYEKILDLVKLQELKAMGAMALLMEKTLWGKPLDASETKVPWGVDYWITPNASQGFNGGVPAGFTSKAGVDPAVHPRFSNYTDQYTDVSKEDLIRKLRRAAVKTNFKSPVGSYNMVMSARDNYGYYTNYNVISLMEEILEKQNESLGIRVDPMDGKVRFRNRPLNHVPFFDSEHEDKATYADKDPFFGINWSTFHPIIKPGWWMNRKIDRPTDMPRSVRVWYDCVYNFVLRNPRTCFRIQKA